MTIKPGEVPYGWSEEAADFINNCLQRKPSKRLGLNGNGEVKAHYWFKEFDWDLLTKKKISPQFKPSTKEDNFDLQHVNKPDWGEGMQES